MLHQLGDGGNAGSQEPIREGLSFVEDHNTVGNVVQLAAAAAAVCIKRFKELDGCGNDYRGIPVFAGQDLAALKRGQVLPLGDLIIDGRKVGQNVFCTQQFRKGGGSLVDDRGVRDHIDHAVHFLVGGMFQRKRKGGKGFTASGGNGQGVKSLRPGPPAFLAGAEDLIALSEYLGCGGRIPIPGGFEPDLF